MEASSQLQALAALSPMKCRPLLPGEPQIRFGRYGEENKPCPYRESNPDFSVAQPLYRLSYCGSYIQNKWLARILEESDGKMEIFRIWRHISCGGARCIHIQEVRIYQTTRRHISRNHSRNKLIHLREMTQTRQFSFVIFLLDCLPTLSIWRRIGWTWIGRDLKGSGRELIKIISRHLYWGIL
jgi:hypothetical protein